MKKDINKIKLEVKIWQAREKKMKHDLDQVKSELFETKKREHLLEEQLEVEKEKCENISQLFNNIQCLPNVLKSVENHIEDIEKSFEVHRVQACSKENELNIIATDLKAKLHAENIYAKEQSLFLNEVLNTKMQELSCLHDKIIEQQEMLDAKDREYEKLLKESDSEIQV